MGSKPLPAPIAIDGPAASGKTTVGQALAEEFGYLFLDTGLMYRAFTLAALRADVPATDAAACRTLAANLELAVEATTETRITLAGEDVTGLLRSPEVEAKVSPYSAVPAVRTALVALQREVATRGPAILAGRDIGTVVLPDAPLKLYLDASEEARAIRRSGQAASWGTSQDAEAARRDIAGRDVIDASRATAPLSVAADAIILDTTGMTLQEVIAFAREQVCASASSGSSQK